MEKTCSSKREQLLILRQSLLCTIIQKPHVISNRHLTDGTLGGGSLLLILQRSIIRPTVISNRGSQSDQTNQGTTKRRLLNTATTVMLQN